MCEAHHRVSRELSGLIQSALTPDELRSFADDQRKLLAAVVLCSQCAKPDLKSEEIELAASTGWGGVSFSFVEPLRPAFVLQSVGGSLRGVTLSSVSIAREEQLIQSVPADIFERVQNHVQLSVLRPGALAELCFGNTGPEAARFRVWFGARETIQLLGRALEEEGN